MKKIIVEKIIPFIVSNMKKLFEKIKRQSSQHSKSFLDVFVYKERSNDGNEKLLVHVRRLDVKEERSPNHTIPNKILYVPYDNSVHDRNNNTLPNTISGDKSTET